MVEPPNQKVAKSVPYEKIIQDEIDGNQVKNGLEKLIGQLSFGEIVLWFNLMAPFFCGWIIFLKSNFFGLG